MKKKSVLIGLALLAGMLTGCGSEEKEIYFIPCQGFVTKAYLKEKLVDLVKNELCKLKV